MKTIWIIVILLYLVTVIFIGTRKPRKEKLFFERFNNSIKNKKGKITIWSLLRYGGIVFLAFVIMILFIPAGIVSTIYSGIVKWKINRKVEKEFESGYVYHHGIGGKCILSCSVCGHEEEIISFLHGPPIKQNGWSRTGYQCQKCFKHITIFEDKDMHPELICECGGKLDREKPLKCSKCSSLQLNYEMTLIT